MLNMTYDTYLCGGGCFQQGCRCENSPLPRPSGFCEKKQIKNEQKFSGFILSQSKFVQLIKARNIHETLQTQIDRTSGFIDSPAIPCNNTWIKITKLLKFRKFQRHHSGGTLDRHTEYFVWIYDFGDQTFDWFSDLIS